MTATDTPSTRQRLRRADARRNYARLLAAAAAAFAEAGPNACLEDIARGAGVGIGTLYRHFPTRQALLEGVYRDRIEALGVEAEALRDAPAPGDALAAWLRSVLAHNLAQRGLKEALLSEGGTEVAAACKAELHAAGAALVARAAEAGAVRPGLEVGDLLRLVYGIALATERAPDGRAQADRLLAIMLDGLRG